MAASEQARMHLSTLGPLGPADAEGAGSADERRLLLRFRDGDPEAFRPFVEAYRAPVYSYLVRTGVRESERDDLFQDIFMRIHAAAERYQAERPLHPWLFTIVANTVRAHQRRERLRGLIFEEPGGSGLDGLAAPAESTLEARQTRAWLERQIVRLPGIQREVLVLSCLVRLPQKSVATALGLPLNTVKTHLRRARLCLAQRLLEHRGGVPS